MFWKEAGYFDNSGATKPLLHLWSLGIEEQFYLIWPLLLWLAWKKKFNPLGVTAVVAVISFFLNIHYVHGDAVASFYSPQTRFWELSCGGFLAWSMLHRGGAFVTLRGSFDRWLASAIYREPIVQDGETAANVLSFAGVFFLSVGLCKINRAFSFPGYWAILPVLGAVLIIWAGPKPWINRVVLSHPVAVWFGLISYPLYLWHWPLLSFAQIVSGQVPSPLVRISALVASVILAWLTYVVVEKRFRSGKLTVFKIAVPATAMALLACVGFVTHGQQGLLFRFRTLSPGNYSRIAALAKAWTYRDYPQPDGSHREHKYGFLKLAGNDARTILFAGDSHMRQYWNTVGETWKRDRSQPSRMPAVLFGEMPFPAAIRPELLTDGSIRTVVFAYYWALKYGSDKVNQAARCCGDGKNGTVGYYSFPISGPEKMNELDQRWASIFISLKSNGKDVYVVLDNPFGEEVDPHFMLQRSWHGFSFTSPPTLLRATVLQRSEPVRSRLIHVAEQTGAKIIDPLDGLCNDTYCPAFSSEGDLLYKDYDHISYFASASKVRYLDAILR